MTILTNTDIEQLTDWSNKIKDPVAIELVRTEHPENKLFSDIAGEMEKAAPQLDITSKKADSGLPGFRIRENILFSALPLQKEFHPFLTALDRIGSPQSVSDKDDTIKETADSIEVPVHVKLYIALACPHCPIMVGKMIRLALHCENIHLEIIDGSLFPEQAGTDKVLSAPTLILDDDFRWTGDVALEEIVQTITARDFSQLGAPTLRTILEQGDAEKIIKEIIQKGVVFDNFFKLLLHELWSVRLGAMVVIEELGVEAPEIAAAACPRLIKHFDASDIPVKGDILYALGEAGGPETAGWIKEVLPSLTHQDLIDAAEDALETLEAKTG